MQQKKYTLVVSGVLLLMLFMMRIPSFAQTPGSTIPSPTVANQPTTVAGPSPTTPPAGAPTDTPTASESPTITVTVAPTDEPTETPSMSGTPTTEPSPTGSTTCTHQDGDINEDSVINLKDVDMLRKELVDQETSLEADMDCDGNVDLNDFDSFVTKFVEAQSPTPALHQTPTSTLTPNLPISGTPPITGVAP